MEGTARREVRLNLGRESQAPLLNRISVQRPRTTENLHNRIDMFSGTQITAAERLGLPRSPKSKLHRGIK